MSELINEKELREQVQAETEARILAEQRATKMEEQLNLLQTQFTEQRTASEALTQKVAGLATPEKPTIPGSSDVKDTPVDTKEEDPRAPLIPLAKIDYTAKTQGLVSGIPTEVAEKVNEAARAATPEQLALMQESPEGKYEFLRGILGTLGYEEKAPGFLDEFTTGEAEVKRLSVRDRATALFKSSPTNVSTPAFNGMGGMTPSAKGSPKSNSGSLFDGIKRAAAAMSS